MQCVNSQRVKFFQETGHLTPIYNVIRHKDMVRTYKLNILRPWNSEQLYNRQGEQKEVEGENPFTITMVTDKSVDGLKVQKRLMEK